MLQGVDYRGSCTEVFGAGLRTPRTRVSVECTWRSRVATSKLRCKCVLLTFAMLFCANAQDATFNRAFSLYQSGAVDEAQKVLETAPPTALSLSLLGSIEYQKAQLSQAERHLKAAVASEPGLEGARFTLANVLEAKGEIEEAQEQLKALVKRNGRHLDGLLSLARLQNKIANFESALSWALKAKAAAPEYPDALFAVGALCLQLDLIKDGTENLERAASLSASPAILYALASARIANRDLPGALALYAKLLEADPANAQLQYAIGATHFLAGEYGLAATALHESLRLQPDQVESLYYLGLIEKESGDVDKGAGMLRQVVTRQPDHVRAHEALGLIYRSQGRLNDAAREFGIATRLQPDSQKAHYQLGLVLMALQDRERAQAELARANQLRASSGERISWQLLPQTGTSAAVTSHVP